jgi:hypothetical protein
VLDKFAAMIRILHRIEDPWQLSDEEFIKRGCETSWFIDNLSRHFEAATMNVMAIIFAKKQ